MLNLTSADEDSADRKESRETSSGPSVESEITWLLHRAAQRMRGATGQEAEHHGLQLRDYIVLSALAMPPDLTQAELAKTLGLDKSTLMTQLDRLERMGLALRTRDPHDRRARIPKITPAGDSLRAEVAVACNEAEATFLEDFTSEQVQLFRRMLFEIIGDSQDRGSCL